jgi:Glycosyltransferase family 87
MLLTTAGLLVVVFLVRWITESPAEIAQSDFVPLQVAGVIVRGGQGGQLYDPVLQAHVYAAVTQGRHTGTLFYIHAPLAAVLMEPFSMTSLDVAFRLWGLAQLACLIAATVIAAWSAQARPHHRTLTALAAGVGLAAPATLLMLLEGQDVGLPALLLACGYAAMRRRRRAVAGVLLAVAALLGKPHLFLGIAVWVLFWGDRRLIVGAIGGAAAAMLASLAAVGTGGVAGFVSALVSGRSDFPNAQESVAGLFSAWTGGGRAATALTVLATVVALIAVAVIARWGHAGRVSVESSLAVAVVLSLLCAPHLYPHDLALLAPVFAWMTIAAVSGDRQRGRALPGPALSVVLGVWVMVAACVSVDASGVLPSGAGSLAPFALLAAAIAGARLPSLGGPSSGAGHPAPSGLG